MPADFPGCTRDRFVRAKRLANVLLLACSSDEIDPYIREAFGELLDNIFCELFDGIDELDEFLTGKDAAHAD